MSKQQAELPTDPKPETPKAEEPKTATAETKPVEPKPPQASGAIVPLDDVGPGEPTRALSAFASEAAFKAGYRMAKAMASSSLVPVQYQGDTNIPNVLIAMELANRIGASVLMVMQSLDIIHGRPSWRAQFLIATVNSSNRFTPLRFRWFGEEGTKEWGCRCVAKDRESGEECVGALITIDLAHAEGWATKGGSKWKTMPEQMLMYRAAAFWTRVYAPELSLGMHTTEEIIDTTGVEVRDATMPIGVVPSSASALEESLRKNGQVAAS